MKQGKSGQLELLGHIHEKAFSLYIDKRSWAMSDIFRDYSFGGWIRHTRLEKRITLRDAAKAMGMHPGNLSKLERSELPPPKSATKVDEICNAIESPDLAM